VCAFSVSHYKERLKQTALKKQYIFYYKSQYLNQTTLTYTCGSRSESITIRVLPTLFET